MFPEPRDTRGVAGGRRVALAILLGLATSSAGEAQSLDPKQPAPLAAGVNKGNVDNITGSHYYFFFAGPGHFDVNMAFKDLGLFGNPYRQALSFDFYDDNAKLMSHNAIVAAGALAHLKTDGDLGSRQRIRLAIIPQQGPIRLGGYYEIEVTGAAEFAGKAGATAGVAPRDSSLVKKPGQVLVNPAPAPAQ
jgi:hypothetical protein